MTSRPNRFHPTRTALALLVAAVAALPVTGHACSVCMGASDSNVAPAFNDALFVMLGLVGVVFAGIGAFIFSLARRARQPLPPHAELTSHSFHTTS